MSEAESQEGRGLPTSEAELGSRISTVLSLYPDRKSAASVAGKSVDQLQAYIRGKSAAPFDVLARLAADQGVNLNWLATGEGPMRLGDTAGRAESAAPAELDAKLMGRITDGITAIYKDENAGLPPQFLGERAARIYAAVAVRAEPEDQMIALGQALKQLRQELRAPRTAGSNKHSA